jgi:hypothetical protein
MDAGWNRTRLQPYAGLLTTVRYPRANRKASGKSVKPGERLPDAKRHLIVSGRLLRKLPAETRFNTQA